MKLTPWRLGSGTWRNGVEILDDEEGKKGDDDTESSVGNKEAEEGKKKKDWGALWNMYLSQDHRRARERFFCYWIRKEEIGKERRVGDATREEK